jgi:hypothetical protein
LPNLLQIKCQQNYSALNVCLNGRGLTSPDLDHFTHACFSVIRLFGIQPHIVFF